MSSDDFAVVLLCVVLAKLSHGYEEDLYVVMAIVVFVVSTLGAYADWRKRR